MKDVRQQLLSGATSGFASTVLLQPFDLLKTRVQQLESLPATTSRNTMIIVSTTRSILSSSGLQGLWRGTTPSLLRNVPGIALYMTSVTQLRSFMASSQFFSTFHSAAASSGMKSSVLPILNPTGNLLAGATTRVIVGVTLNPFTIIKSRYESGMYAYSSIGHAFRSIFKSGPSELFRGALASSFRDAPYAGLFLLSYEALKHKGAEVLGPHYSTTVHSLSAASASGIATLATQPFDVIKTKVQIHSASPEYQGFLRTLRTIYQQRGLAGYFAGGGLRMSRKVLSSAIGWAIYEAGLISFGNLKKQV